MRQAFSTKEAHKNCIQVFVGEQVLVRDRHDLGGAYGYVEGPASRKGWLPEWCFVAPVAQRTQSRASAETSTVSAATASQRGRSAPAPARIASRDASVPGSSESLSGRMPTSPATLVALHSWSDERRHCLSVSRGDELLVSERSNGWCYSTQRSNTSSGAGWIPEWVVHAPQTPASGDKSSVALSSAKAPAQRIGSTLGARSQSTNSQLSAWFRHSFDADARDTPAPGQPASLDATDAECPGVQKRLRIWTFGLKTLDGFEYRGLGITAQIEELKAALQGGGVENVDLVFDVRTFHDPDCEVNRHIGAYPEIFEFLGSKLSKFSGELRSACLRITTLAAFHNLLGLRKTAGVVLRPRPPAWFATERLEHSDLTARGEMPESVVHYDLTCFWLRAVDAWSGLPLVLIQWPSDPS